MANWQGVREGLVQGYQVGRDTGGGRMGQLGSLIKGVADRLRTEREAGEETKRKTGILGIEGFIKGLIEPSPEGKLELPGIGRVKQVRTPKKWEPTTKEGAYEFKKIGAKPEITRTAALGIISDPIKAEQLRTTYPDVYSVIESVAKGEVKKGLPKAKVEEILVISPDGERGHIPKSQLQKALKEGYKRTIK